MLVKPGTKVKLKDHDPDDTGAYRSEEEAEPKLQAYLAEMAKLQYLLYADNRYALLIVLQGIDTSGKDGIARHVLTAFNPIGLKMVSFKVPSEEERDHDFLWRIHKHTPAQGDITVFNRSHYEDVLVVRVEELVLPKVWKARYQQINIFEKILTENNTVVLKFFLHISKKEQKERFEARLKDPTKQWKFSRGDLKVRARWDDYQKAYEDALSKCSTDWAPWHIVPADKKWYRNLYVAEQIVQSLRALNLKYPKPTEDLSKIVIE